MQKVVQLLRFMRFIKRIPPRLACMLLTLTSFISLTAYGQDFQNAKVNLELRSVSLKEAFAEIQKQSSVRFIYDEDIKKYDALKITQSVKDITVKKAVELILKGTNLKYVPEGSHVMISEKQAPKPSSVSPSAPSRQGQGTGSLKGRVVELETSLPLPGASVFIVELNKGTTSNSEGYYQFNNIKAGNYTLSVSFVGYTTEDQVVHVKANGEEIYDIKLQGNNQLGEVVITATGKTRRPVAHATEKQVLQEIKAAQSVVSGISSQQISMSADRNVADAVKKISGVTVKDDRFIVIRGMNERYNLIYLNENVAPSTEIYSRTFSLDLLPTRIIDRIMVYKSPTPHLLGDMTGGAVKIFTKDAKAVKHFDIEVQAGYREGTTFKDFLTYKGGKTDWLGFDDGTRKLPSVVPGYGNFNRARISQKDYVTAFSPTLGYNRMKAMPMLQLTANYYNTARVAGRYLSWLTSLSYKNEYQHYVLSRAINNKTLPVPAAFHDSVTANGNRIKIQGFNIPVPRYDLQEPGKIVTMPYRFDGSSVIGSYGTDDQSIQSAQVNLLQNFTYNLNSNNKLYFRNYLLQQGQNSTIVTNYMNDVSYLHTGDIGTNYPTTYKRNITLSWTQRFLYTGNLGGTHKWQEEGRQHLNWNLGLTLNRLTVPDQRQSRFENRMLIANNQRYPVGDFEQNFSSITRGGGSELADMNNNLELGKISRVWIKNSENVYNGSLDYVYKINDFLHLKTGTYHQWKKRRVFRRNYTVNEGDLDEMGIPPNDAEGNPNGYPGTLGNFMDWNKVLYKQQDLPSVWSHEYLRDDSSALKVYDRTGGADAYMGTEQNNAFYAAVNVLPASGKIDLYGGVRVEYNRQRVSGAFPPGMVGGVSTPVFIDLKRTEWLPSVNFSYRPSDSWVLRAGYGKTVNRPEFREITPYSELDYIGNQSISGNNELKGAVADNGDIRFEFYPKANANGEMISVGAFMKHIKNPIERTVSGSKRTGNLSNISFSNADEARLYGAELDIQKRFDFIDGNFFRNLSFAGNAAYLYSRTSLKYKHYPNLQGTGAFVDTVIARQMQGQPAYTINAGMYYENAAWGTKLGIIFNKVGDQIYAVAKGYRPIFFMDQRLSIDPGHQGSIIELSRNLLDASLTQRIGKGLQLKFSVQNLLNSPVRMAEDANFTYKYEKATVILPNTPVLQDNTGTLIYGNGRIDGDMIFTDYKPGRSFILSISYSL